MPASHLNEITDYTILAVMNRIVEARVTSTGLHPVDTAILSQRATNRALFCVTVTNVWEALKTNELQGDNAEQEIVWAIGIACEPDGLPDNACVELLLTE